MKKQKPHLEYTREGKIANTPYNHVHMTVWEHFWFVIRHDDFYRHNAKNIWQASIKFVKGVLMFPAILLLATVFSPVVILYKVFVEKREARKQIQMYPYKGKKRV